MLFDSPSPRRRTYAAAVGLLAVLLLPAPAWSETPAKESTETRTDEKAAKSGEAQSSEEQEEEVTLTAGWDGSHPYIKSSDGNFLMKFGGRMQLDYRAYEGSDAPVNSFFLRRARLEAEGELYRHFEFKVQVDFAETGGRKLRDAFLNINANPVFQVKAGQFKAPFSQEELQSSKYIDFVERSSVNNLVPGRTPGVMLHGKASNGFEYAFGFFNGEGALGEATADQPEVFLRLRHTIKLNGGQFAIGAAASNGSTNGTDSFRGRASSRSETFFDDVPVNGGVQRYNAEFWWTQGSYSLRGEYVQTAQMREGLAGAGVDLPVVTGKGYVVQATYLLTGEKKGLKEIKPNRNFLDGNGGAGAWELAYRFERLQMDDRANSNHAIAHTFGVNWWMNKFVRYQANIAFERFNDPLRAPEPGKTNHLAFLTRIQVIF